MITYNPRDWFKIIIHFHRSDTFRILLPTMSLLGLITALVCYFEKRYVSEKIPNLLIFHQISGFILSLVLVFRINTAYDRWWEGRKLWGSLLNNARNLAIRMHAIISAQDITTRKELATQIANFGFSLRDHLRGGNQFNDIQFVSGMNEAHFTASMHKPNMIAARLTSLCLEKCNVDAKRDDYLVISTNLGQFTDICGACERIKNTPIPYSYSLFIKKVIFLYIITMPIAFGMTIGYWSIPVVMIMFYAFASLELISEEIEDPFGTDSNDLPTDEIAKKIKVNVNEILLSHGA